MSNKRPYILTIAGFDPSAGAGILADLKTFEQNKCMGMAVQTANTIQTEDTFHSVNWVNEQLIMEQLTALTNRYEFEYVKIGLVQGAKQLSDIIKHPGLKKAKLIWDPVLKSSSGFDFEQDVASLSELFKHLYLITPNTDEVKELLHEQDEIKAAKKLAEEVKVLLKGGHREKQKGKDLLFDAASIRAYNPKPGNYTPKHGSGCVFSSAIAANLAKGYTLHKSILRAKRYVERYLVSNSGLLGHHHNA
ncbi:MAG: hydroxymethylpyrimidine/phosphomethylpyrimidine kinase [Crocinitomicaceae bacterium]